jgi:predicted nuclease with TOPRIM domain
MDNAMPPEDRSAERFGEVDAQIASLCAAAESLREQRLSWFEHIFHPGRLARRQGDFNAAVAASLRTATEDFAERERRFSNLEAEVAQLREGQERLVRELSDLTNRAAETRQQLEPLARAQSERIEQLVRDQSALGNELRERIQHVLDEQRVAIRQLSLKASEDAILSDRARRATELKLEELAKRVPPPPA